MKQKRKRIQSLAYTTQRDSYIVVEETIMVQKVYEIKPDGTRVDITNNKSLIIELCSHGAIELGFIDTKYEPKTIKRKYKK